jgi:DNA-binding transcriptional ArsR family regulator
VVETQHAIARRPGPAASVLVVGGLMRRSRSVLRSCVRRRYSLIYNRMVVDPESDAGVDRIFHALADGTRRDIVAVAVGGRYTVSALANRYPMSFAAVQKHVAVLEGAGLVTKERRGRERLVHTDVDTVQRARMLLDGIEELWRARVDRIDDLLVTEKQTTGGKR